MIALCYTVTVWTLLKFTGILFWQKFRESNTFTAEHSVEISKIFLSRVLREINFGDSRSAKTAVFALLGAVNDVHMINIGL